MIGLKPSRIKMAELKRSLIVRQLEYITSNFEKDNCNTILNSSILTVLDESGYVKSLGVSAPADLFTDVGGKMLAGLLSNSSNSTVVLASTVGSATFLFKKISGSNDQWFDAKTYVNQVVLGSEGNTVQRSNSRVTTPVFTANASNWGYGSGVLQNVTSAGPFGSAVVVREGGHYMKGTLISFDEVRFLCWLRYNYSDTPVGIGESVSVETTINI
jgi:hypothetical protein